MSTNQAERIVEIFGSQSALAQALDTRQSTVAHWVKTGNIPTKWHTKIIEQAKAKDISLTPSDFVEARPTAEKNRGIHATHFGVLTIGDAEIPCYVLSNGERVIAMKGIVSGLIGTEGGQLTEYLKVRSLRPFLPQDLTPDENEVISALIRFDTGISGESFARNALGLTVDRFMDVCEAYARALEESLKGDSEIKLTERQFEIATRANIFIRACAKTGITALVDEATGYQYDRAPDALQMKLKLYLAEEMRQWEKTFPDQLWEEFGRLTKWDGPVHRRPKYWGKLVMELIYGYLDADVAKWLKENAPKPRAGQQYHQWLSSQYGLLKLTQHIYIIIGMAISCSTMEELRRLTNERFGGTAIQLKLYLPPER